MKRRVQNSIVITNIVYYIYGKMKFEIINNKYYVTDDTLTDIKLYNSKRERIYSDQVIEVIKEKLNTSDFFRYCFYNNITESEIIYIPVCCYDIMDNILFDIRGSLKCGSIDGELTLLSTEIFSPEIYEQEYLYQWPGEYPKTACTTLEPLLLDRIKNGYYDYALIEKYSSRFINPFKN